MIAADREKREVGMYGMTEAGVQASYGPESFNWRGCGGPMMLAASIMSDAQETMARGDNEGARMLLNRAKWVLFEATRREREGVGT